MSQCPKRPLFTCLLLGGLLAAGTLRGDEACQARLKRDVTFLASDECEGRGVGTKGLDKAADYIVAQFTEAGLKPGGAKGTYFQPFTMARGAAQEGEASLVLQGPLGQKITLTAGKDFHVMGMSGSGKVSAPVVFAGYGAMARDVGYADYDGIDVKGKVVLVIRRTPRWGNKDAPFDGTRQTYHAELENKLALAAIHGAAAVIMINDASEPNDTLMSFKLTATAGAATNLPFVQMHRGQADEMLQSGLGLTLQAIEQQINRELKPHSAPLAGWKATLEVNVTRNSSPVKNVIGIVPGGGPLAEEILVIGSHYDHLGYGGAGSREPKSKAIHHGADDNGSGTTAMMELARRFAAQKDRQGRKLIFMAFSAEESGLIGSRFYCRREPLFPLKDTVAMVNLDMVGRLRTDQKTGKEKLLIEGSGTAKSFDQMLEKLNPGFQLSKKAGGNGPSDHDSFYNQSIPVVFLWTGLHDDYHKPSDTADKINVAGMDKIVDYAEKIITQLSTDLKRPEYVAVASSFMPSPGAGKMARLGIMPDYDEAKPGVRVDGVSKGGPADKAGLKVDDLIVEIAGRPVTNIQTYMAIMGQQKAGQAVDVTVMREGKKVQLKVVPQ